MKKHFFNMTLVSLMLFFNLMIDASDNLHDRYKKAFNTPSDINEHLPILYKLSKEGSSVVEIGMRGMVSTWGILYGLSTSDSEQRTYTGIDIALPPKATLKAAQTLASTNNINFNFIQRNDMEIQIPQTDLLFIDSLHTYCHLYYELEKFSPSVRKYIALHDTSPPWELVDDTEYRGDYSEYPESINKNKRGLWAAVEDFLKEHPEWELKTRYKNCHGFTVLERRYD